MSLKLHQKAMQVIPKWMDSWEVVPPVPRSTMGTAAFHNLHERLFRAFQPDEQIRADLLAACEAVERLFEPRPGLPHDIDKTFRETVSRDPVLKEVRAAVAKAKGETDDRA